MICTEQEARKKWCPMVRFSADTEDGNSANRWFVSKPGVGESYSPEFCRCIASDCMMWRWAAYHGEKIAENKSVAKPTTERGGYCGLGGTL